MAENPNKISQIQVGSVTYDICDAVARDHTIIDDDYVVVDNNFPTTNETKTYGATKGFYVYDSTNEIRAGLKPVSYEDGRQGVSVITGRKINDSHIYNEVFLGIKPDGSRTVRFSEAAPWRTALGLNTISVNLTKNNTLASWTTGKLYCNNKVVTIVINAAKLASALASGNNSIISTIPEGYRPPTLQRGPVMVGVTGNYGNVWFAASSAGNIQIANRSPIQIPTTAELSLQITYLID